MKDVISSMKLIRESRYIPAEAKREFDAVMPLVERFGSLGPNARRVLLALADRLVAGKVHGDFDKPHDWDKESSEEALDLAVYQAAKLLGLGKESSARSSPELEDGIDSCPYSYIDGNGKKYLRCRKGSGPLVDEDGRTPDGKPWVPPAGARVRVVYQPEYGRVDSIVGRTLTVERVKQVQKPIGTIHDGIVEIEFEGFSNSRDVRVVPT